MSSVPAGLAKTERRLTQELLPTAVCQNEVDFHTQIRDWDAALEKLEKNVTDLVRALDMLHCRLDTRYTLGTH